MSSEVDLEILSPRQIALPPAEPPSARIPVGPPYHFLYRTLDGKEATNQTRLPRHGAKLSFLSKASLAAAATTAFQQRVWVKAKKRMLTLAAIDSLFAATEDASALFNPELLIRAKLAILLAVYVWCTPLVVIFASETLAVELTTVAEDFLCPFVRSLNFDQEGRAEAGGGFQGPFRGLRPVSVLKLGRHVSERSPDETDVNPYLTSKSEGRVGTGPAECFWNASTAPPAREKVASPHCIPHPLVSLKP